MPYDDNIEQTKKRILTEEQIAFLSECVKDPTRYKAWLEAQSPQIQQGVQSAFAQYKHEMAQADRLLKRGADASEILKMTFNPLRFVVSPYLTDSSVVICAGRPKTGKSWLAFGLALDVVSGRAPLGRDDATVDQGEVLYLALEDNQRRLQNRMRAMLDGRELPPGLHVHTEWKRLDEDGMEDIRLWAQARLSLGGKPKLVVVDTLAKVKPRRGLVDDSFAEDYGSVNPLKALADAYKLCFLLVHHTRKADGSDWVDSISGTLGLSAAADGLIVLQRGRGQADGILKVTGRDIEEAEDALRFDADTGRWSYLGSADEFLASEGRAQILQYLRQHGRSKVGKIAKDLNRDRSSVSHMLARMQKDGMVVDCSMGEWVCAPSPLTLSHTSHTTTTTHTTHTTQAARTSPTPPNGDAVTW